MDSNMWLSDSRVQRGVLAATAIFGAVAAVCYFIYSDDKSGASQSDNQKKSTKKKSSSPSVTSVPSHNASQTLSESDPNSNMKGYKITQDGRKTTYFNRELSEKDKSLLGDSTPKPISPASPMPIQTTQSVAGPSAWNAAGTWEEKDCTTWAKDKIKSILQSLSSQSGSDRVSVSKVKDIQGEASITLIRGKKKYLYDISLALELKGNINGSPLTGEVRIQDITGDHSYEITWATSVSNSQRLPVMKEFQTSLKGGFERFLLDFQNYS